MARIWVVCLLASLASGNMVGTLVEGTMKTLYTKMEMMAQSVQDLYYIQQMNPKHDGIDSAKSCPSIVQEGDRDLDLLYYTLQTTLGLEKLRSKPECKYTVTEKDEGIILKALESPANVKEFYMAIGCELIRGNMIAPDDAIPMYAELVKQDDSVLAGSLAVLGSIMLWRGQPTTDLGPLLKVIDIKDMFAQADSFDKQLSFDGNIATTSHFVKAAIAIGEYTGTFPLTAEQMVGFGNFAVRGFRPVKAADFFYHMSLLSDLQYNKFAQPLHVKMISQKPLHHAGQPLVLGVFAVDGSPMKNTKVTARSITRVEDNEVIVSNVPFKLFAPKKDEQKEKNFSAEIFYDAVYEYLFMKNDPKPGFYDVEIEVSGEKYFAFSDDAIRFRVKVVSQAEIKNVRIGLGTKEKSADTKWHESTIDAEAGASVGRNGRIKVEFDVLDKQSGSSQTVHQAFVRCLNHISHNSVTFIAEQKNGKYSAQFDVTDHFEHGGSHTIHVIAGDPLLFPGHLEHVIGKVQVNGVPDPEPGVFATKYLDRYRPLTEIKHTFKEPEARPPVMISLIFTGACAVPLLGLLIAWGRMGVNINRMESSFMPFHVAIAAVFGLYFMYWLKFNMFTTLKWLAVLGSATFILGNKVLSALATKEK